MTLKDGTYRIRFVPTAVLPPFLGGLYATATGFGEPILAEAEDPNNAAVWEVHRNAETGRYIITQPGFQNMPKNIVLGPGPVLMGWSLANPSKSFPGGNILFKVDYTEFDIQPVGEGENVVYRVPNPEGVHGVGLDCEFYVTEHDHVVISRAFWSNRFQHRPHPHWEFIPVERK